MHMRESNQVAVALNVFAVVVGGSTSICFFLHSFSNQTDSAVCSKELQHKK